MSDHKTKTDPFAIGESFWDNSPFTSNLDAVAWRPGSMNLAAPALGSMAAMTALSAGMAAQMWGLWFGVASSTLGSVSGADKYFSEALGFGLSGSWDRDEDLPRETASPAEQTVLRTKAAAKTAAAEVELALKEVDKTQKEVISAVMEDVGESRDKTGDRVDLQGHSDDLKEISGVGPKLEELLRQAGIRTFEQIVALTPEEIDKLDRELSLGGRIDRDGWIEQARRKTSA